MLVEYAARRSVAPISSVMASSALRMTSKRTGSMSEARARSDGVGGGVMGGLIGPRCYSKRMLAGLPPVFRGPTLSQRDHPGLMVGPVVKDRGVEIGAIRPHERVNFAVDRYRVEPIQVP